MVIKNAYKHIAIDTSMEERAENRRWVENIAGLGVQIIFPYNFH